MKKAKFLIPVSIILAGTIIGGFYYAAEVQKSQSIERQQRNELDYKMTLEENKQQEERRIEEEQKKEQSFNRTLLNACLSKADSDYWAYMDLNGTKKDDGTIWASNPTWDRAEENKQNDINNCYRKYQ